MPCCRTKFKSLKNAKKPTGDATCPEPVKMAKHIAREIEREASVFKLGDDEEEDSNGDVSGTASSSSDSDSEDEFSNSPIRTLQSPPFEKSASPKRYGIVEETLPLSGVIVQESIIERISVDSDREENDAGGGGAAVEISDAQKISQFQRASSPLAPEQDDSHNLDDCKQKSKKSRSNHPSVAGSYVPDRLGKNATELMAMKVSKQPALVPQHPLHSKKRSILKELKDVDEAEAQAKQDSAHQILVMHRSQEMQFQEKMLRLEMRFEEDKRRWEEEKEIKKEERRAQQAKMDADQRQQALLFHSAISAISALTGNLAVAGVANALGSVLAPSAMPPPPPRD